MQMNKTAQYTFTILVPFYNEEDNIYRLEKVLGDYLKKAVIPSVAVLFINDGSKDNGLEMVKEVCSRNEHFYYTWSKYVGYIDADLQTSPEDFNLLLPHAEEYPLVMGIRANRKDSFFKNLQSKIANGFRRMMTHDNAIDTGCPLKVFQTEYAKRIPMFNGMHRFFPALIQLQEGGKMMQIAVRHFPRQAGVSKYNLWNRLIAPFKDCFAYRWMKKRYINYTVANGNIES